jgi:hypothetical protein
MQSGLPKMFCVSLRDHPKRVEYAKNHFKQHDLNVEFFEGINGKKFGLSTKIPYTDDHTNWDKQMTILTGIKIVERRILYLKVMLVVFCLITCFGG